MSPVQSPLAHPEPTFPQSHLSKRDLSDTIFVKLSGCWEGFWGHPSWRGGRQNTVLRSLLLTHNVVVLTRSWVWQVRATLQGQRKWLEELRSYRKPAHQPWDTPLHVFSSHSKHCPLVFKPLFPVSVTWSWTQFLFDKGSCGISMKRTQSCSF
jgi:hypothetical protein